MKAPRTDQIAFTKNDDSPKLKWNSPKINELNTINSESGGLKHSHEGTFWENFGPS